MHNLVAVKRASLRVTPTGSVHAEARVEPSPPNCYVPKRDLPEPKLDIMPFISDTASVMKKTSHQLRVNPTSAAKVVKSDRTRADILNAALEFIWSRPFREMSVSSLMATTNISRSAFYQYFEDQQLWP